jgi:hypothetical protein
MAAVRFVVRQDDAMSSTRRKNRPNRLLMRCSFVIPPYLGLLSTIRFVRIEDWKAKA